MKRLFSLDYPWKDIFMIWGLAYLLGVILFPERFWLFNVTWIDYSDSMLSYAGAFYVTNSMYHGGVNLWNQYDQMPTTFFHLNFSMYKFSNMLTAFVYGIVSPFTDNPAKLFHIVFSGVFMASTLFIRIVGFWALLGMFVKSRWLLICCCVYASIVQAPAFMMGLSTNIIYSLFPLLIFFILRLARNFKWEDVGMFIVIWAYCIATDFFCGLGYLYQSLHFVILPAMMHAWKFQPFLVEQLRSLGKACLQYRRVLISMGFLLGVMMLANAVLVKVHFPDYEFGMAQSRMQQPLSIKKYFERPTAWAPQENFLKRSLDYTENLWSLDWLYMGPLMFLLVFIGVCTIKDHRKWVLVAAGVLYVLINSPHEARGVSAIAQWVNALTNPLKFLPRSMHMSCAILLPVVLMPLAAGGASYLVGLLRGQERVDVRLKFACWLGLVALVCALPALPDKSRLLVGGVGVLVGAWLLGVRYFRNKGRVWMIGILTGLVLIVDAWGMSQYVRNLLQTILIKPRPVMAVPSSGPVVMDYQNPRIMPWRTQFSLDNHVQEDTYLLETAANNPGMVFRYTNFIRYYRPISNYLPRHKNVASWASDQGLMYVYLKNTPGMLRIVPYAIEDSGDNFRNMVALNLSQQIAVVKGAKEQEGLLPILDPNVQAPPTAPVKVNDHEINAAKILWHQEGALKVGQFKMPRDMSPYEATTWLTPDRERIVLSIVTDRETRVLKPVQGMLTEPLTFDVNNVRDGWVSIALLSDESVQGKILLRYPSLADESYRVLKNTHDQLHVTYHVIQDGWLIWHMPFDSKWHVTVNGKKVKHYQVNRSFMGIKVEKGEQDIQWIYWPSGWWVRVLVMLAAIGSVGVLVWILIYSCRCVRER